MANEALFAKLQFETLKSTVDEALKMDTRIGDGRRVWERLRLCGFADVTPICYKNISANLRNLVITDRQNFEGNSMFPVLRLKVTQNLIGTARFLLKLVRPT